MFTQGSLTENERLTRFAIDQIVHYLEMESGHYQTVIDLVVPLFASAGEKPGFALAAAMARMAVRAGFDQGEETQPDPDSQILIHHYIVVARQNFVDYQNRQNRHNSAGSQMIADWQSFPDH